MEVRKEHKGAMQGVESGALHQTLTLNVWGGCCDYDQGVFCCLTLEDPCPFACEGTELTACVTVVLVWGKCTEKVK